MEIHLEVNGKTIEAEKGEILLAVLNRNGMHVPTICNLKDFTPTGACRMCVVEVEGRENLVPACSFPIEDSHSIWTHSPRVLRARRTNVELLLSNHPDDCLYCERSGTCELQTLAEDMHIRERRISGRKGIHAVDRSSPAIVRDPSKCILCGRCVRICEEVMNTSTLDFSYRGNRLGIATTLSKPLHDSNCTACGQCLNACPTGALVENIEYTDIEEYIHDARKTVVAQYTPAVFISVAEQLGYKPGTNMSGIIHAVLKRIGFDYVYMTSFGSEILCLEQARVCEEMALQSRGYPVITSSCPAWVQYAEQYYPSLIPHLSPLKSPHQILGSLIREWFRKKFPGEEKEVISVLITSCTAAKREARRDEMTDSGVPVIDLVLTTRELVRLIRLSGLDLDQLTPDRADDPFQSDSSAGILPGVAGGEIESIYRTLYKQVKGMEMNPSKLHRFRIQKPFREMAFEAGEKEFRVGSVSGLRNCVELLEEIDAGRLKLDLLEVMACPGGCINGGGQPYIGDDNMLRVRSKALYDIDNASRMPVPIQDPMVDLLYKELLGEPGGARSRELLYTTYTQRNVLL